MKRDPVFTFLCISIVALLIGILLPALGAARRNQPGPTVSQLLVTGWFRYPVAVLPRVRFNSAMLTSAAVYLVALGVGTHLFLRWLVAARSQSGGEAPKW